MPSAREASTGMATGRRQHKPYSFLVSAYDNTVMEIKSPRDVATGQSSGKASYSDLSVMISMKGSSGEVATQSLPVNEGEFTLPSTFVNGSADVMLSWSWGASNSGSSTRCTKTFIVTMQDGVCMAINEKGTSSTKK